MLDRVIYVVGYGRSGSTLLDMMLGAHPDIFGAGEMSTICRHVWPNDEYCSCRQRVRSCPVWSGVIGGWQQGGAGMAAHLALQKRIEPILAPRRLWRGGDLRAYREQTLDLYRRLARATGRRIIVDSSKSPGRALALIGADVDLRIVHLVRDPRAVAWSMSRPMQADTEAGLQKTLPAHPVARTALRWAFVNAGAETARARLPASHALRLRYEDMVADPQAALNHLGAVAGVDLGAVGRAVAAGQMIAAEHQVAGSRIRMTGAMRLRPDMGWRDRMSAAQQAQVTRICGWQMRRYGYAGDGNGAPATGASSGTGTG